MICDAGGGTVVRILFSVLLLSLIRHLGSRGLSYDWPTPKLGDCGGLRAEWCELRKHLLVSVLTNRPFRPHGSSFSVVGIFASES